MTRMSDPDGASEAARALNRQRWGDQALRKAVATVVSRADELSPDLRAELRAVTTQDGDGDG
jgi:hypothetical protein